MRLANSKIDSTRDRQLFRTIRVKCHSGPLVSPNEAVLRGLERQSERNFHRVVGKESSSRMIKEVVDLKNDPVEVSDLSLARNDPREGNSHSLRMPNSLWKNSRKSIVFPPNHGRRY